MRFTFDYNKPQNANEIVWGVNINIEETEVKKFYKLARALRKSRTLIIDVRGNKYGSFYFIEKWQPRHEVRLMN